MPQTEAQINLEKLRRLKQLQLKAALLADEKLKVQLKGAYDQPPIPGVAVAATTATPTVGMPRKAPGAIEKFAEAGLRDIALLPQMVEQLHPKNIMKRLALESVLKGFDRVDKEYQGKTFAEAYEEGKPTSFIEPVAELVGKLAFGEKKPEELGIPIASELAKSAGREAVSLVPGAFTVSEIAQGRNPLLEHPLLTGLDIAYGYGAAKYGLSRRAYGKARKIMQKIDEEFQPKPTDKYRFEGLQEYPGKDPYVLLTNLRTKSTGVFPEVSIKKVTNGQDLTRAVSEVGGKANAIPKDFTAVEERGGIFAAKTPEEVQSVMNKFEISELTKEQLKPAAEEVVKIAEGTKAAFEELKAPKKVVFGQEELKMKHDFERIEAEKAKARQAEADAANEPVIPAAEPEILGVEMRDLATGKTVKAPTVEEGIIDLTPEKKPYVAKPLYTKEFRFRKDNAKDIADAWLAQNEDILAIDEPRIQDLLDFLQENSGINFKKFQAVREKKLFNNSQIRQEFIWRSMSKIIRSLAQTGRNTPEDLMAYFRRFGDAGYDLHFGLSEEQMLDMTNYRSFEAEFNEFMKQQDQAEPGTELYSFPGINPKAMIQGLKQVLPKSKGAQFQAPQDVSLGILARVRMPQNAFNATPAGQNLVFLARQTERGFANAPGRAFEKIKTLMKVTAKEKTLRLAGLIQNYSKLKQRGVIDRLRQKFPDEIAAVEEHRALMDNYRARLWRERKDAGYPVPDDYRDWGIDDYMTMSQPGNFKIWLEKKNPVFASTLDEAHKIAEDWVKTHPGDNPQIEGRTFVPSEAIAWVSGKQKRAIISALSRNLDLSFKDVATALRGTVHGKEVRLLAQKPKKRFAGIVQRRRGFAKLTKYTNVKDQTTFYIYAAERFLWYNRMRRLGQKLLDRLPSGTYKNQLTEYLKSIERPPTDLELDWDNRMLGIPVLGEHVRPFFLRRGVAKVTNAVAVLKLANPRFWIQNSLQTWSTVYPVVGEQIFLDAWKRVLAKDPVVLKLIKDNNAVQDVQQFAEYQVHGLRSKITKALMKPGEGVEKMNQAVAFWSGYRYAKNVIKMPDRAAVRYAHDFVDRTQFPSTPGTESAMFRTLKKFPPVASALQFKSFSMRFWENALLPYGFKPIFTKPQVALRFWGGWSLMGGTKLLTSPIAWATAVFGYKTYSKMKREYGEQVADAFFYGLPGLIGADLSNSLAANFFWGTGSIFEQVGQTATGPAFGDVIRIYNAIHDGQWERAFSLSPITQAPLEIKEALGRKGKLVKGRRERGLYRVTPFQRLLRTGGIRTTAQSVQKMRSEAIKKVEKEYTETRQEVLDLVVGGNMSEARKLLRGWNKHHSVKMTPPSLDEIMAEKRKKRQTLTERELETKSPMRRRQFEREITR